MDIKSEIARRVESLPVELQRQLLAHVDNQTRPLQGEEGKNLLHFAGALDDTSALEMTEAIEAACEGLDSREW